MILTMFATIGIGVKHISALLGFGEINPSLNTPVLIGHLLLFARGQGETALITKTA
jgi:hypothetical protein